VGKFPKKISISALSFALLSGMVAPSFALGAVAFSDVDEAADWAQAGIRRANELGVVQGYTNQEYRPTSNVSRAEAAAMFAKLLKLDLAVGETNFSDVSPNDWYAPYTEAMQRIGLMNGVGQGRFDPEGELTREQLAVIWVRAAELDLNNDGSGLSFGSTELSSGMQDGFDLEASSEWARSYLQELNRLGISFNDSGTGRAKEIVQRQELAVAASQFAPSFGQLRIDSINGDSMTVDGTVYTITDEARGLLREVNEDALRNAEIRFRTDGTRITGILYLAVGTTTDKNSRVLDAGNTRIDRLRVTGSDVTIRSAVVGDLVLDRGVQNGALLEGIQVTGSILDRAVTGILTPTTRPEAPQPPAPTPTPAPSPVIEPSPIPSSPPVAENPNPIRNVTGITVSGSGGADTLRTGESLQMTAAVTPSNATNQSLTWSVQNGTGSATINSNGLLSAVTPGSVTVTAAANDGSGVKGTRVITITNELAVPVSTVTVSTPGNVTTVQDNQTLQATTTVSPNNATNPNVTWTSSDTSVATVDSTGLITAVAPGTVTVTAASVSDPTKTDSVTITVTASGGGIPGGDPFALI